jgi:hypothetical protein
MIKLQHLIVPIKRGSTSIHPEAFKGDHARTSARRDDVVTCVPSPGSSSAFGCCVIVTSTFDHPEAICSEQG